MKHEVHVVSADRLAGSVSLLICLDVRQSSLFDHTVVRS